MGVKGGTTGEGSTARSIDNRLYLLLWIPRKHFLICCNAMSHDQCEIGEILMRNMNMYDMSVEEASATTTGNGKKAPTFRSLWTGSTCARVIDGPSSTRVASVAPFDTKTVVVRDIEMMMSVFSPE